MDNPCSVQQIDRLDDLWSGGKDPETKKAHLMGLFCIFQ
jgi:hypothetical protein